MTTIRVNRVDDEVDGGSFWVASQVGDPLCLAGVGDTPMLAVEDRQRQYRSWSQGRKAAEAEGRVHEYDKYWGLEHPAELRAAMRGDWDWVEGGRPVEADSDVAARADQ